MTKRRGIEKLQSSRLFRLSGAEGQKAERRGGYRGIRVSLILEKLHIYFMRGFVRKILDMNKNNYRIVKIQRLFLGET